MICVDAIKQCNIIYFNLLWEMSAVDSKMKWRFVVLLLVFKVTCTSVYVVVSNNKIVERISRRQTGDLYYFINHSSHVACHDHNRSQSTYLISENVCVKDQELLSGKLFF